MNGVRLFELGFTQHPKIIQAGPLGLAMFVTGVDHAVLHLTDGHLSAEVIESLVRPHGLLMDNPHTLLGETVTAAAIAARLTDVGLWHRIDGGYLIHDFDVYQPTKSCLHDALRTVTGRREKDAERQRERRVRGRPAISSADPPYVQTPSAVVVPAVSPLAATATDTPAGLPILRFGERLELCRRYAERVRDADERTPNAWATVIGSAPAERTLGRAFEALADRRGKQPPLESEARYVTGTLRRIAAEEQAA